MPPQLARQGTKLRIRTIEPLPLIADLSSNTFFKRDFSPAPRHTTTIQHLPGSQTWPRLSPFPVFKHDHLWALLLPPRLPLKLLPSLP
ncbi:hypothetical protein COCCADRAFT_86601 [Bipolaris zeicola 26-R-13]|uniref:Uncharacterized protein n=1 Tax=Cochliobolus carbonum (strain 26-R-13) TaxID=930089 RepID=W6Z047_COCC2|nr:uncharacterized protein COCCADRAFT_86601 [Bipolaris zeicola 26-R-13]EUC37051.1 hypothetical protein COCCADRAFT_86601 [Bipolaris zeicola 26-R-13]